jgi:hypothetical protein
MSSESSLRRRRRSKPIKEKSFPISLFGECVVVVARGIKPARWLSDRIACSERQANFIIAGRCKPSFRAVHAVNAAWLDQR